MKIYARTEEGHNAAYSLQSALPRKLKSILKVIDGKTPTRVYKNNLSSFGDVEGLLRSLEIAGLLREISESAQEGSVDLKHFLASPVQALQERDAAAVRNRSDLDFEQISIQGAPQLRPIQSLVLNSNASGANAHARKDDALRAMLDEMANFVLTQMPEKSFQILKEIEDITSLEVLAATLGGYGQMVSDLGQIGTTHLLSIQTNLREHL